ncbi:MAG: NAD(P)/FAD-dependent oxidoreductase [Bacillota bacterium]|nr:NAD(P)/FAD-dependent oxidoreductase [Bacillota bacterium]
MYDVIIIGSGPAGLMAGIELKRELKVLMLEKNEQMGKKLLVSGAGQCNFTHSGSILEFFSKYNNEGRFIKRSLSLFSNEDLIEFFIDNNLDIVTRDDGKVFPKSLRAKDLVNIFERKLRKMKREIKLKSKVIKIEHAEDFTVHTETEKYESKHLIIATGGMTYPSLGTSGDGYEFAKKLGHLIEPLNMGLSPVYIKDDELVNLSGITLKEIEMSQYRSNKKLNVSKGDLLFTHKGLSGPIIIDNSRYFKAGDELRLNFGIDALNEKKLVKNALREFLPEKITIYLIKRYNLDAEKPLIQWNKKEKNKLNEVLHESKFSIDSLGNINESMVTCGGVSFKDISSKTLESRKVPRLYFAGEVLDVDGESGGYNIQAAFSMGHLVADEINSSG